jgi:hypothetical protein
VAGAALPVAIGLLALAAGARGALAARVEERIARLYLEPLSTWAAIAFAAYLLAVLAAGHPGVVSIAVAITLGAVALLLREPGTSTAPAATPPPGRPATTPPAPAGGPLSDRPVEEPARTGLWSHR